MERAPTARAMRKDENVDQITQLKKSPIHGIKPIGLQELDISLIDTDSTNPGADQYSGRYERRWQSISDSFDIIGGFVYPLVVCQRSDIPGRYLTVDGHGRGDEAKRRRQKKVRAFVYPPLTLEQRICLRETLNAAQEPFDTPLVLKDLHLLARERGLDIKDEKDLRALLADLPVNVRKHEAKLKLLAKWPADVADKIGIDDDDEAGVVGYDKIKELGSLVSTLRRNHPESTKQYDGDQLSKQILKLYLQGMFRDGRRSQDTLRDARRLLKKLPQDHALVKKLVKGTIPFGEFKAEAELKVADRPAKRELVELCKELNALLTDVDAHNLTAVERRSLKRTADLVSQVLSEVEGA